MDKPNRASNRGERLVGERVVQVPEKGTASPHRRRNAAPSESVIPQHPGEPQAEVTQRQPHPKLTRSEDAGRVRRCPRANSEAFAAKTAANPTQGERGNTRQQASASSQPFSRRNVDCLSHARR